MLKRCTLPSTTFAASRCLPPTSRHTKGAISFHSRGVPPGVLMPGTSSPPSGPTITAICEASAAVRMKVESERRLAI